MIARESVNDRGHSPRRRCAYCDQPFLAYHSSSQKYCSQECYRKANQRWDKNFGLQRMARVERDARTAERVTPRPVPMRAVTDGPRRYTAVDANAFLEEITAAEHARPGHPCG